MMENGQKLGLLCNTEPNTSYFCSPCYLPLTCFLPLRWMASILIVLKMGRWVHIMHVNLWENMKYTITVTRKHTYLQSYKHHLWSLLTAVTQFTTTRSQAIIASEEIPTTSSLRLKHKGNKK